MRVLAWVTLALLASASIMADSQSPRMKRQLGKIFRRMTSNLKRGAYNIGSQIGPQVHYVSSRIAYDVAPTIGKAIMDITNHAAISTAETMQHGAKVFRNRVFPVLEDGFVEIGNAAVPPINKGIDMLEAGFEYGLNMLGQSTSKGINKLGSKVLGEQRHNRVKNIANNLSGGLNSGIHNLASAISSISTPDDYYEYKDYNEYSDYNSLDRGGTNTVMRNAAYSITKHFLGENLTQVVAPLARTISDAVSQNMPILDSDHGKSIDYPDTQRKEKLRDCTTPYGAPGFCKDLSDCPDLVLDLTQLRKSICFKSFFTPGVCCHKDGSDNTINTQNTIHNTPIRLHDRPVTTSTTRRPFGSQNNIHQNRPHTVSTQNNRFDCGIPKVPQFRVVGGDEAQRGQWPWMAAIFLHGPKKTEFWCGASLISSQHVLTAAHCTKDSRGKTFDAQQFTVRLGDHNVFSTSDDHLTNAQTLRVSEIRPHPDFKAHGFYNDVAVLKLENRVVLSQFTLPVCLPSLDLARKPTDYLVAQTPTVIGYGSTHYGGKESTMLRQAKLPVWKNRDCDEAYFQPITESFLCAGFAGGGSDACQGDSGGPLQLYVDGNWVQIGIVSFGNRCAEPGYPGVYTRLTKYLNWILNNMY